MSVTEKPGPAPQSSDTKRLEQSIITLNNVLRKEQRYIMDKYKITGQEMEILQFIIENGPQKMKAISEHFNIKLSTLTSVIDKAEKRRVVKRVNSKEDRRVVFLEASKKGEEVFKEYNQHLKDVVHMLKDTFDDNTFNHFVNGMEAFTKLSAN